jgi:DNA-binding LacI/PurR family transcriptional regulator
MGVTSADVARHAGLSRATVSQVLNGHSDRFAAGTVKRVLEAARELGYEPSAAGRMLRTGSSDFVIALIPNTTFGGNLQDIFDTVTDLLAQHGLTLVLRLSTQSPSSLDRVIASMRPRAVLSLEPFTETERRVLAERGVPGFDTSTDGEAIGGDINYEIGRIQTEHLVARGYEQIAFAHLRDRRQDTYGDDREAAVRAVCANANLPAPTIVGLQIDLDDAERALALLEPGFGIVCYNDDVAITLLSAAARRGWRVPADIGLIGMDHTPLSQVTNPRLTTVGYDLAAVARAAAAMTLRALGEQLPVLAADIDLRVIPGEST